jgi:hypothetical protein
MGDICACSTLYTAFTTYIYILVTYIAYLLISKYFASPKVVEKAIVKPPSINTSPAATNPNVNFNDMFQQIMGNIQTTMNVIDPPKPEEPKQTRRRRPVPIEDDGTGVILTEEVKIVASPPVLELGSDEVEDL